MLRHLRRYWGWYLAPVGPAIGYAFGGWTCFVVALIGCAAGFMFDVVRFRRRRRRFANPS